MIFVRSMNIIPISLNNYNNNINFTAKKPCITGNELKTLIQTHTPKEIAELKGVTERHIKNIIKFYEVENPYLDKKNELKETITSRLMNGETLSDISKDSELSINVVKYLALKILGKDKLKAIKTQTKLKKAKETPKPLNIAKQAKFKLLIDKILNMVKEGSTFIAAAKEAGIHPSTISRYIDKKELAQARSIAHEKKQARIKSMVKNGYTVRKMAKELNSNPEQIYYAMGKEYRSQWKKEKKQSQIQQLLNYQLKGLSNEQIAEKMKISIDTVKRLIKASKEN